MNWKGEVISAKSLSSHADQRELINWLQRMPKPSKVALIHGEPMAKEVLAKKLTHEGFKVFIPQVFEELD